MSVLFDLLNQLALEGALVASDRAETAMACEHLPALEPQDLVITDRGYSGFFWFLALVMSGVNFVGRCSRGSFPIAQELFARNEAGVSVVVELQVPESARKACQTRGWPLELKVRFVTARLETGELEVLATSLLDEVAYPSGEFKALYWRRWGHEIFYGALKGPLDLEHFTGKTVHAVEQDFQATLLLSNVERVVVGPAAEKLAERSLGKNNELRVNRAVSFHALKSRMIELLASQVPVEEVLQTLTGWFLHAPVSVRPERKVPRRKPSPSRSYHHRRRVHKVVF
jgi:hypothetical protein